MKCLKRRCLGRILREIYKKKEKAGIIYILNALMSFIKI